MSNTPKKNKSIYKNKKAVAKKAKVRAAQKNVDDNVCIIEETLLPARVYFYDEDCCCLL